MSQESMNAVPLVLLILVWENQVQPWQVELGRFLVLAPAPVPKVV